MVKNRFISGIIFLLSASLVSIVILQALWIDSAWQSKREDFDRNVKEALTQVTQRLETKEAVSFIHQRISFSNANSLLFSDSLFLPARDFAPNSVFQQEEMAVFNSTYTELHLDSNQLGTSDPEKSATGNKDVVISSAKKSKLSQDSINKRIKQKSDQLYNVIHELFIEWSSGNIPIVERLKVDSLYPVIKEELVNKGIDLPFEFAVVQGGSNDSVLPIVSRAFHPEMINTAYRAFLFPNDIVARYDQLLIHFDDTRPYFISALWWILMLSLIFLLLIIGTFGSAIYIILKQKKVSEIKTDFINNMTHEFKTPIATISVAIDAINNPKVLTNQDRIRYYSEIIGRENMRMNAQVENILQMALLDKDNFELNEQLLDVHELIHRVADPVQLQVEQRNGRLELNLKAENSFIVADEMHLTNIIFNLLDNANKYSTQSPQIALETHNEPKGIVISVKDRGMGMSTETQRKIFEKFFREPSGNVHNVKGFGLGLSYVKSIIKKHGGTIKVFSELGSGSRFEIFLPFGHQQAFEYGEKTENTPG